MALEDTITVLGRAPIFGLMGADALRIIAFSADTRRLRAGEVLFRRGERSDGGYVVMSGLVAASRRPGEEADAVLLGPGSLVGRIALFVRMQRPASATARDASSLMRISPTLMRRVLQEFPLAASSIRAAIADELADLSEGLDEVQQMLERIER